MANASNSDNHEFGDDRADKVPTTNQFASAGSNPIWNTTSKQPLANTDDNVSRTSGDSDLIGVEDNPDFDHERFQIIREKEFSPDLNIVNRVSWPRNIYISKYNKLIEYFSAEYRKTCSIKKHRFK